MNELNEGQSTSRPVARPTIEDTYYRDHDNPSGKWSQVTYSRRTYRMRPSYRGLIQLRTHKNIKVHGHRTVLFGRCNPKSRLWGCRELTTYIRRQDDRPCRTYVVERYTGPDRTHTHYYEGIGTDVWPT